MSCKVSSCFAVEEELETKARRLTFWSSSLQCSRRWHRSTTFHLSSMGAMILRNGQPNGWDSLLASRLPFRPCAAGSLKVTIPALKEPRIVHTSDLSSLHRIWPGNEVRTYKRMTDNELVYLIFLIHTKMSVVCTFVWAILFALSISPHCHEGRVMRSTTLGTGF